MLTINRQELTAALRRAAKIAPKHSSIATMRMVRLTADGESLMLQSTNLEQSLVEILPAQANGTQHSAGLCLPLIPLLGVVQALPQYLRDIPLEVRAEHALIGTTKLTAGCLLEDFPTISPSPDDAWAIIELPDDFPRHVRFVLPALSRETARYALTGILFDLQHGNLVGCDGKRLHCAHLWQPSKLGKTILPPEAFDVDVPTHLVLPKPDDSGETHQVFLLTEHGYLVTRTLEGKYPDYRSIVRKEHTLVALVDRAELASALDQAIPLASERSPSCALHLNEHLEIHAENTDTGAAYLNEVQATVDGPELTVRANPHYLRDLLRAMTSQEVTLAFRKAGEAIYVVNDTGDQWALLMPLTAETPAASTPRAAAES